MTLYLATMQESGLIKQRRPTTGFPKHQDEPHSNAHECVNKKGELKGKKKGSEWRSKVGLEEIRRKETLET